MRKVALALILFCAAALANAQSGAIFLVRHAEKASNERDPELSAVGQKRAECLAQTLRDANIKSIFVTEFKRTQETAAPLAKAAGVSPTIISGAKAQDTAEAARQAAGTGAVLIVGHSNTIPEIAKALGAQSAQGQSMTMADDDYDRLLIIHLPQHGEASGAATLETLHVCQNK